jgi:hypothetical protein
MKPTFKKKVKQSLLCCSSPIFIWPFSSFLWHLITLMVWGTSPKGREAFGVVWVEHAEEVLKELVALSYELFRFLALPIPTTSRCVPLT